MKLQSNFRLDGHHFDHLDKISAQTGLNRSEILRQLIDQADARALAKRSGRVYNQSPATIFIGDGQSGCPQRDTATP